MSAVVDHPPVTEVMFSLHICSSLLSLMDNELSLIPYRLGASHS